MNPQSALGSLTLKTPAALYLLVGVGLIALWSMLQAETPRKLGAPLIRALVLALAVLALAGPERMITYQGTARPAAIDLSSSITPAMRRWSARLLAELGLRPQDPAVIFGKMAQAGNIGGAGAALNAAGECRACQPGGTDLETALRALVSLDGGKGGPAVLVTDGWENHGSAERIIPALLAARIRLQVFTPPGAADIPNVAMTELTLPSALPSVEPFSLGVTMLNMNGAPAKGTIALYENDRQIDQRQVTLAPGEQRLDFPVRSAGSGLISYRASFTPADRAQDVFAEDDSLQEWVGVGAKRRILILTGNSRDARYLEEVAKRLGLEPVVTDLSGRQFEGDFNGYDAVVLNNVARARLAPAALERLKGYVQHGGSLAMIGGDQSFGLGGYEGSAAAEALPVVMKPPQHRERQRALVLIIDKSGSMGRNNKLTYAKAAARTVTKTLRDDDLLSVIGFDSQPFVIVPLQPLRSSRPYLGDMIDRLKARGTTYLLPALEEAERDLAASGAASKHVVILTDGETGGTAAQYYDLVSSMRRDGGATISTIAIGQQANLRLLDAISRYGGGGSYHTDSPSTLPEIFLQDIKEHGGELTLVEKDFTPRGPSPNPVLKDLAGRRLPDLKGYVGTELKPGARLDLFVDRAGRRDPLIASWRYGAGKGLAVTTDASGRWSSQWIRAGVFGQVYERLLGWLTPESHNEENFDVVLGYQAGNLVVKLTDYSADRQRVAHLVSATVARPDATSSRIMLSEDAPGELHGSLEAPQAGTYYVELKSAPGGKERVFPPLAFTVSPAVLAELPHPDPNYGLLERLASATGGRLNPAPGEAELARPVLTRREAVGRYLLLAAMVVLVGEALVRRLSA